jgi:hypothetical protein
MYNKVASTCIAFPLSGYLKGDKMPWQGKWARNNHIAKIPLVRCWKIFKGILAGA